MFDPGTRLGPYEVVAPLGGGGMGEVYRARDLRLGRELALKVLPPALADEHTRYRFEQEGRAASALTHPNIVTIYDVGHADGTAYLAMELVAGRTLRAMLEDGPLAIRTILALAVQLADALTAAHEKGIVHRDLKPENVVVTGDGVVKILDFGIAKSHPPRASDTDATAFATMSGSILGTPGYMSPEQVRGQDVDFRTDQFSLGALLHELATGRRAFAGSTAIEAASAVILLAPPPLDRERSDVPPPLQWVVERCLAKDAHDRYHSTRDLLRDLLALKDRLSSSQSEVARLPVGSLPGASPLIGRDADVASVKTLLGRDDVRWVTLTGAGGVGKSRLALQVAHELVERYAGAVYFVPLAAVTDPQLVPSAIARSLEVAMNGAEAPAEALRRQLGALRTPVLLVIDNFEQVAGAAPEMAELVRQSTAVKLLVTSRAVLHVSLEREFPVLPLPVPDRHRSLSPESLAAFPAVTLFVRRAAESRPGFALNEENAAAVAEICARLDGLPMAIELAAARTKVLPPAALLQRLEGRLLSLTGGARDLPERQQTVRATLDWSYALLQPEEQRLFRRAAVFAGGFTLESVEAVCDARQDLGLDVLDGVSSLVDKSLCQRRGEEGEEPRFVMLELLREYGLEQLERAGEADATRRAHAAYFLVVAEEGAAYSPERQADWLAQCDAEFANLRAALGYLAARREVEWALRLATALFSFWHNRGHLAEGRRHLQALLEMPAPAALDDLRARAAFSLSTLLHMLGEHEASLTIGEQALAAHQRLGNRRGVAVLLNATAIVAGDKGDHARARAAFEQALAVWLELGDGSAAARTLSNLAALVASEGDYASAHALYERCRSMFVDLRDDNGVAWTWNHEGDAARGAGDLDAAQRLFERALGTFERLGDQWGIGSSKAGLGRIALDRGDLPRARRWFADAMTLSRRVGDPRSTARLLETIATAAARNGNPCGALRLAGAAAALRRTSGAQLPPADREALQSALEQARGAPQAGTAWMDGWSMTVDQAIEEGLAALDQRPEVG